MPRSSSRTRRGAGAGSQSSVSSPVVRRLRDVSWDMPAPSSRAAKATPRARSLPWRRLELPSLQAHLSSDAPSKSFWSRPSSGRTEIKLNDAPGFVEREAGPSWARPNWPVSELDDINLGLDPTQAAIESFKKAATEKAAAAAPASDAD